jgi:hypothetical protein
MANDRITPIRINRVLVGEPLQVGEYTVEQTARLTALAGAGGGGDMVEGGGAGGWLRLSPMDLRVHDAYGAPTTVKIRDPQLNMMRAMFALALSTAGIGMLLTSAARRWRRR